MMAETLIQIGGQTVSASAVTLPSTGRVFRDAWQLNGDVVEIDMAKAKDIRIEQLLREASEGAEAARMAQKKAAAKGDSAGAAAEAAKATRLSGVPAQAAQQAIANATTPDALAAVTLDVFLP